MSKHFVKFILGGLGIVLVAIIILSGVKYFEYRTNQDYQAAQYFEDLKQKYAEDIYGGDTPEETLGLFIDALKKGDTDLAAKYFILDKQASWREDLAKIKEKNLLETIIKELEKMSLTKKTESEAFFTLIGKDNIAKAEVFIGRNPSQKKWKIYEL